MSESVSVAEELQLLGVVRLRGIERQQHEPRICSEQRPRIEREVNVAVDQPVRQIDGGVRRVVNLDEFEIRFAHTQRRLRVIHDLAEHNIAEPRATVGRSERDRVHRHEATRQVGRLIDGRPKTDRLAVELGAEINVIDEPRRLVVHVRRDQPDIVAVSTIQREVVRIDTGTLIEIVLVENQECAGGQSRSVGDAKLFEVATVVAQVESGQVDG